MNEERDIQRDAFSERVQAFLRASGYNQKQLANELYLNPKVLSRKLNRNADAYLTHVEIRNILLALVRWHAITTQDEAFDLLELAKVGEALFLAEEWQTPPLNQLVKARFHPVPLTSRSDQQEPVQHNLPAATSRFIGRSWAVERLRRLFERDDVRLVTLFGAGGSGKTRLALHMAHELINAFPHGVWLVELAGVSTLDAVPMSIIQALDIKLTPDVSSLQGLRTYLDTKQMLLILDNVEQVVGNATEVIDAILVAAPKLKILVTSRMVLHLRGEHTFGVPPLDVPDTTLVWETTQLEQYEAVQLFVERACAVVPDFALTDENKDAIAQICVKLDGLPLALELAAARIKVLSPAMLLERLSKARLSFLTKGARNLPSRQQTLRNTIQWSYDLLSSYEQEWFPRLGVFRGSWSLDAVEVMMHDASTYQDSASTSDDALDMIERLVDNSLLTRLPSTSDQMRFTMLETLREYALERLTVQKEIERWRDWHACYYLDVAEAAEKGLRGPQQRVWLARLTKERDNFRAALEWLLLQASNVGRSNEAEASLRLVAALRPYWEWQGYLTEGRDWLRVALSVSSPYQENAGETIRAARANALSALSRFMCLQDEQTEAIELAEESIALWRTLNRPAGLATALLHLGWTAHALSNYKEAERVYQEGLDAISSTEETWLRAQLLMYLGAAAGFSFNFDRMRSLYAQSQALFEQLGDTISIVDILKDLGGMLILQMSYTEAIEYLLKSVTLCHEMGHKQFVTTGLGWLGFAIGLRGEPNQREASLYAAQIEGAVRGLMDAIGSTSWTRTHPLIQVIRLQLRSYVEEQQWEEAWNAGRLLTETQAIALAYQLAERRSIE